jgi:Flp pilus assembly secretin CpaC
LLRSTLPKEDFEFVRSTLIDVLDYLADKAGLAYQNLPPHSRKAQILVTFRMKNVTAFDALEAVARQNGIRISCDDGVWYFDERDDRQDLQTRVEETNELIGVIYQLKHDPVDLVDFSRDARGGAPAANAAAGGASGPTTAQLPLQYSQRVFEVRAPRIVNEIRVMLGMQPLQYNADGTISDPEIVGGQSKELGIDPISITREENISGAGQAMGATQPGVAAAAASGAVQGQSQTTLGGNPIQFFGSVYLPPQKPQVIYNSDTNILWVVATRKQHKWVADYLSRVDKPQDLIAIEVKFFETQKNPQTDFGINWEGVLGGDGLQITGEGAIGGDPLGAISGANGAVSFNAPYSAVLSVQQATLAIQAFARDRQGSLVQYPRVLTINNREVAITSSENTPVNSGVQNVSSGNVGGQNVGSLSYLPTGTQINILPKAVGKDQIALTVAITISSIIGREPIDLGTGVNQYPITAERVYNASLQVDSGYTLAVGGLEKSSDERSTGGVPVLKDIPGLGYLFKNKTRNRNRSNLIIFITPYVIDDPSRTPGVSVEPESTLPVRPGLPPPAPNFAPGGQLVGGAGALLGAFTWLEYQLKYFRQINKEARDDAKSMNELRSVIQRARSLHNDLQMQVADKAGYAPANLLDDAARAEALLNELNKVLAAAQLDQFQLNEGFP